MEMKDWEIIHILSLHKNITKASKELYISQPALTSRIKAIEQELGITLLIRNNKGIEFTSVGKYVLQHAETALNDFKSFKEDLQIMDQGVAGNLRIATPYIFSKYKLPEIISEFQKLYPDVDFDVSIVHSKDVLKYLKDNFYHFGFIRSSHDSGFDNMLHVESSEISIVSKNKFTLSELPRLKRIEYQTDISYKNLLDQWWDYRFKQPPTVGVKVGDLETCIEMVLSGIGYAFLPSFVIPKNNVLYVFPMNTPREEPIRRHTWMVYQESILQRQLPKIFHSFVKNTGFVNGMVAPVSCATVGR